MIGGLLTSCAVVGISEMVEVLVVYTWWRIVDIHDTGMLIPVSV